MWLLRKNDLFDVERYGIGETNLVLNFLKYFVTIKTLLGHWEQNQIKKFIIFFFYYQGNNKATRVLPG